EIGDRYGIASALCTLANLSYDQGHYDRALSVFQESLTIRGEIGDKHGIAECLEGLARVAIAENQFERAIQLSEAAATQREVLSIQPSASGQEQSDLEKARARGMLEDDAFTSACEQGRAMTLEQAIALGLM
ncbi:MAG: tetratricopeptide repeat protein, partial [Pyrinomonadaceae bacterium]|nr:tetratricopeptide repeat protein [Pyrinomonadaceae bacterium]